MRLATLTVVIVLAGAGTASAQAPTMRVQPNSVFPGERVVVSGSAGGCAVGNEVALISPAFAGGRRTTPVRADGTYRAGVRVPQRRDAGRYRVSGRCGGGNFGISRRLTVRQPRASYCSASGDLCYGRLASPLRLSITLAAEFFERYRLCVRGPDGERDCKQFRIRPTGSVFGSTVRWRRQFPDRGPGTYRVRWILGGEPLGPTVVFFR